MNGNRSWSHDGRKKQKYSVETKATKQKARKAANGPSNGIGLVCNGPLKAIGPSFENDGLDPWNKS